MDHDQSDAQISPEGVKDSEQKISDGVEEKNASRPTGSPSTTDLLARAEAAKEVSAATVGRMLGLATSTDLKLLEGKMDLIQAKVTNLTVRLEKALSILQSAPTGSDLERIDVQIGGLKTLIVDVLAKSQSALSDVAEKASVKSESPKPRARIISSNRPEIEEE